MFNVVLLFARETKSQYYITLVAKDGAPSSRNNHFPPGTPNQGMQLLFFTISMFPFIHLSNHSFIYPIIPLFIQLIIHVFIFLYPRLPIHSSFFHPSFYPIFHPFIHPSFHSSFPPSSHLSIHSFIRLSFHLSTLSSFQAKRSSK